MSTADVGTRSGHIRSRTEAKAKGMPLICRTFSMPEEGLEPPTRGL